MSRPSRKTGTPPSAEREARVREAAYRHYLRNGARDGHALDDWLAAEAEIDAVPAAPADPPRPAARRRNGC